MRKAPRHCAGEFFHAISLLEWRFCAPCNPQGRKVDKKGGMPTCARPSIGAMKKILPCALLLCALSSPLSAMSLYAGLDAASLLSLAYDELSIRGEAALGIGEDLRVGLGVGLHSTLESWDDKGYGSVSLNADYFPFSFLGLYVGMSLMEVHMPFGLDSDGIVRFSNSLRLGWALELPYFTADLRVNIRDLVSASAADSRVLADTIGQLGRFSFTCMLSYRHDFNENQRRIL